MTMMEIYQHIELELGDVSSEEHETSKEEIVEELLEAKTKYTLLHIKYESNGVY